MLRNIPCLMAAFIVATIMGTLADHARAADDQQRQLIDILQSDAPAAKKAITCKQLAVYGTADAVPALAPLLTDAELASWARIALEVIPDPTADEALRAAMEKVDGRLLVGVINSIGVRRDAAAVDRFGPAVDKRRSAGGLGRSRGPGANRRRGSDQDAEAGAG